MSSSVPSRVATSHSVPPFPPTFVSVMCVMITCVYRPLQSYCTNLPILGDTSPNQQHQQQRKRSAKKRSNLRQQLSLLLLTSPIDHHSSRTEISFAQTGQRYCTERASRRLPAHVRLRFIGQPNSAVSFLSSPSAQFRNSHHPHAPKLRSPPHIPPSFYPYVPTHPFYRTPSYHPSTDLFHPPSSVLPSVFRAMHSIANTTLRHYHTKIVLVSGPSPPTFVLHPFMHAPTFISTHRTSLNITSSRVPQR